MATYKEIEEHWHSKGRSGIDEQGLKPTARDPFLQSVIEHSIKGYLNTSSRILDVGCGDGASTLGFAREVDYAVGIDYVADFVETARNTAQKMGIRNVSFERANVLDLAPVIKQHGYFDIVISIRCLINLPNWDVQKEALEQIYQAIKPGGFLLVSEGWQEEIQQLNNYRRKVHLEEMNIAKYNNFISRSAFESRMREKLAMIEYVNFGLYLFLSRCFQPMYVKPESPSHTHRINDVAAEIFMSGIGREAFSECDYAGLYVFQKEEVRSDKKCISTTLY